MLLIKASYLLGFSFFFDCMYIKEKKKRKKEKKKRKEKKKKRKKKE